MGGINHCLHIAIFVEILRSRTYDFFFQIFRNGLPGARESFRSTLACMFHILPPFQGLGRKKSGSPIKKCFSVQIFPNVPLLNRET